MSQIDLTSFSYFSSTGMGWNDPEEGGDDEVEDTKVDGTGVGDG